MRRVDGHPVAAAVTMIWSGDMDAQSWPELRRVLADAPGPDTRMLILDLEAVTFFDSSSIRAVIGARAELEEHGVALHIDRASPIVASVLAATGLSEVIVPSGLDLGPSPGP